MMQRPSGGIPAPILTEHDNTPETSDNAAVELVADYSDGTIRPTVNLDWERLSRGELSARLSVQDRQGDTHYIPFTLREATLAALSSIGERYQPEGESASTPYMPPEARNAPKVAGDTISSPSEKVNDLVQWQQFLDTVRALKPQVGYDNPWSYLRQKLLDRVDLLYAQNFSLLREQLRNERGGAKVVRMLFDSRNEVLVDMGLRLVALEPGLEAAVQDDLVEICADDTVGETLRQRAFNRLNAAFRSVAESRLRQEPA